MRTMVSAILATVARLVVAATAHLIWYGPPIPAPNRPRSGNPVWGFWFLVDAVPTERPRRWLSDATSIKKDVVADQEISEPVTDSSG